MDSIKISVRLDCIVCKKPGSTVIDHGDWLRWKQGRGDLLVSLTDDERELLISGVCSDCWEQFNEEGE